MSRVRTAVGVASLMAAVLLGGALATIPTPLYAVYSAELGLDSLGVTATFAVFACGAVGGLLGAAALSRVVSRRRAYVAACVLQAIAAVVLGLDLGLGGFVAGRVITGLGVGVLAASGTAFMTEVASRLPGRGRRSLTRAAPAVAYVALGAGPLAGGLAGIGTVAQAHALFRVIAAAIVVVLVISVLTLPRDVGRAIAHTPAPAAVPLHTGAGAFAAFMTTGLFGAVTTAILAQFGASSSLLAGAIAGGVFFAGAAGIIFLGQRVPFAASAFAVPIALLVVAAAVQTALFPVFLLAALAAGCASGALFARGLRIAVGAAPEAAFRQTSIVFACGYAGLAVPVLGLGLALRVLALDAALWLFAGVTAVAGVAAVILRRR